MATALDRWDEEGGAQELAWPLPYEASDLRDVERRVLECLGAALVGEWNDLPTDFHGTLSTETYSLTLHDATVLKIVLGLSIGLPSGYAASFWFSSSAGCSASTR